MASESMAPPGCNQQTLADRCASVTSSDARPRGPWPAARVDVAPLGIPGTGACFADKPVRYELARASSDRARRESDLWGDIAGTAPSAAFQQIVRPIHHTRDSGEPREGATMWRVARVSQRRGRGIGAADRAGGTRHRRMRLEQGPARTIREGGRRPRAEGRLLTTGLAIGIADPLDDCHSNSERGTPDWRMSDISVPVRTSP